MAKIRYAKGNLELEINPVTRWQEAGEPGPNVEYEIGLYYDDAPLFNDKFTQRLLALKDSQAMFLSEFINSVLGKRQEDNWIMLDPKVSVYMTPRESPSCCGQSFPKKENYYMEIKLDQHILAEQSCSGVCSDTGLVIKFEAERADWAAFAAVLNQEEDDFDEEDPA